MMLYQAAFSFYNQGDYQKAIELFTQLVVIDAFDEANWRGLASSHQMMGNYQDAIQAWALVAILNPKDPYAHFHAAECLLSLNEKEEALKALKCAEKNTQDGSLRTKIELLKKL